MHLAQLIGSGFDPYPLAPGWLAAYFVSLTLLDPLAAVLLLQRRRAGLILGCAVLLTDAGANAYADYVLDPRPGITAGRVGQAVITLLALALCAGAPRLWPWLRVSVPRWGIPLRSLPCQLSKAVPEPVSARGCHATSPVAVTGYGPDHSRFAKPVGFGTACRRSLAGLPTRERSARALAVAAHRAVQADSDWRRP